MDSSLYQNGAEVLVVEAELAGVQLAEVRVDQLPYCLLSISTYYQHESGRMSADELTFKDIPHSASDAMNTTEQTHKFTEFPPNQADSDPEDDNIEDTEELLEGSEREKKPISTSFWTFEYYQQFFDVDSVQVGNRILWSMIPHPKTNFLQSQVRPNPDLYGPFWICTTLVFCMAIAGNIVSYIQQTGQDFRWSYDFHKVTFSATAIYTYWWLLPAVIWGLLYWRGNKAGVTFLEILCIYGYSLSIFIPISVLWMIQINWLQWLLVMLGMAMSGTVLLLTFWPIIRNDDKKIAVAAMVLIVLFHGLLAVSFMLYFFHVPTVVSSTSTIIANKTESIHSSALNMTKG